MILGNGRAWQNVLAGTVILSVAKNLAYAAISARFFAATKIGKSLAYASGYYFHGLWVPHSAMRDCAQNDESGALAISSCHARVGEPLAERRPDRVHLQPWDGDRPATYVGRRQFNQLRRESLRWLKALSRS